MSRLEKFALWAGLPLLLLALAIAAWFAVFSGENRCDPRGPRYVLWKHGILPMPKDTIYRSVLLDTDRDRLVRGLTIEGVRAKFGDVRTPGVGLPLSQQYYETPLGLGKFDHAWLGDSCLVVIFEEGRAVRIVAWKG